MKFKFCCIAIILLSFASTVFSQDSDTELMQKDRSGSWKIPDNTRWPREVKPGKIELTPGRLDEVKVPLLYRKTRIETLQILQELGLKGVFRVEKPKTYTEYVVKDLIGKVHKIIPKPGTMVKPGTVIVCTLGPSYVVRIPDILGDAEDVAIYKIKSAGLKFQIEEKKDSFSGPYGVQNWRPYYYAYEGDNIFVRIIYPEVPSIIGLTPKEARDKCKLAGLVFVGVMRTFKDPDEFGKVLEQNPNGGKRARVGDIVTGVMAEEMTVVPGLIYDDVKSLAFKTEAAGLFYKVLKGRPPKALYDTFVPPNIVGKVWKQDPPQGLDVKVGTIVAVTIGEENGVHVPPLYDLGENEAKEILTEAGLTYEIRKMTQTYYAPRGIYEWSPKKFAYEGDVIQVDIEYPEVPQLRGMTKDQAILAIKNASLKPDVQVIDIVYDNPGVYVQNPAAGTLLIKNSTVKARVAIILH